jgi:hypothetical protein
VAKMEFTKYKYIQVREYKNDNATLDAVCMANIASLFGNLVEFTVEWDDHTPEQRGLEISHIAQVFPKTFVSPGQRIGTGELMVLAELRTQLFLQLFLEAFEGDDMDRWNTEDKFSEAFDLMSDDEEPITEQKTVFCFPMQFTSSFVAHMPDLRTLKSRMYPSLSRSQCNCS